MTKEELNNLKRNYANKSIVRMLIEKKDKSIVKVGRNKYNIYDDNGQLIGRIKL